MPCLSHGTGDQAHWSEVLLAPGYESFSHKQVDGIEGTEGVRVSTSETSTRTVCYQTRSSEQFFSLNICCVTRLSVFTFTIFTLFMEGM